MDHGRFDVFLLANRYTLLDQQVIDTLFPRILREGVAIVCGAPLNSGILATGPDPRRHLRLPAGRRGACRTRPAASSALTDKHGTTLIRAALNFPLGHEAITAIIPGFSNATEFADNMAGYRKSIPDALWNDLRAEGLIHQHAPAPVTPALS